MKAIILAAGEGTRLRPLTLKKPKCLVEVAGESILDRQLRTFREGGIEDITIVVGYRGDMVLRPDCRILHNAGYADCNMVASLMCAKGQLNAGQDVVISYADIIFEPRLLDRIQTSRGGVCVAVDTDWQRYWGERFASVSEDCETLRIGDRGLIEEIGDPPIDVDEIDARYIGLVKVSASCGPRLVELYESLPRNHTMRGRTPQQMYMTDLLQLAIDCGWPVQATCVHGGWLEVDSIEDLQSIERLIKIGLLDSFCRLDTPGPEHAIS